MTSAPSFSLIYSHIASGGTDSVALGNLHDCLGGGEVTLKNMFLPHSRKYIHFFIDENVFKNVVCIMVAILYQPSISELWWFHVIHSVNSSLFCWWCSYKNASWLIVMFVMKNKCNIITCSNMDVIDVIKPKQINNHDWHHYQKKQTKRN